MEIEQIAQMRRLRAAHAMDAYRMTPVERGRQRLAPFRAHFRIADPCGRRQLAGENPRGLIGRDGDGQRLVQWPATQVLVEVLSSVFVGRIAQDAARAHGARAERHRALKPADDFPLRQHARHALEQPRPVRLVDVVEAAIVERPLDVFVGVGRTQRQIRIRSVERGAGGAKRAAERFGDRRERQGPIDHTRQFGIEPRVGEHRAAHADRRRAGHRRDVPGNSRDDVRQLAREAGGKRPPDVLNSGIQRLGVSETLTVLARDKKRRRDQRLRLKRDTVTLIVPTDDFGYLRLKLRLRADTQTIECSERIVRVNTERRGERSRAIHQPIGPRNVDTRTQAVVSVPAKRSHHGRIRAADENRRRT